MNDHDQRPGVEQAPAQTERAVPAGPAMEGPMGGSPLLQRKLMRRALQRRAAREGAAPAALGGDEAHATAAAGVSGAPGALPHGEAIQAAFGHHDLSAVQAHVGGPAAQASDQLGAAAYATGNQVAFAQSPDLHTAAHEAAHVVQQRAGVHLKGGVGEAGDEHERHADAVADAVVRGESAQPLLDAATSGRPHAAGATSAGPPQALQKRDVDGGISADREPKGQAGTTATAPTLALGTQVDAQGQTTGAPQGTTGATTTANFHAEIVAGPNAKLRLPPGQAPTEDQLFHRRDDNKGTRIGHLRGSLDAPCVDTAMMPDSLFIGGQPVAADVRQGGIGDCYFMSVLLGIANGDPARIKSMMALSGGTVRTTFHRLNTATNHWEPVTIADSNRLQTQRTPTGAVHLTGAGLRIADQAASTDWYVHLQGSTLEVKREDTYEVALWAPLMEKSYADFTQRFGRYGKGKEVNQPASGYDTIDQGGGAQDCYNMFYGDAVANTGTQGINAAPGTDLVATNLPALQRLVDFAKNRRRNASGGAQRFMQARVSPLGAAQRCGALVTAVQSQLTTDAAAPQPMGPPTAAEQAERDRLTQQRAALTAALPPLVAAVNAFVAAQTPANSQALAVAARAIQAPGAFPLLWSDGGAAVYRQLRESLGIVINLGTDNGPGRRTVYAAHSYNVNNVRLADHAGAPLDLTSAQVALRARDIDVNRSVVIMENPHAMNEPDETGAGPADGVNDGRFTMSLDQFFRSYDLLRLAEVTQAPEPPPPVEGDFPSVTPGANSAYA